MIKTKLMEILGIKYPIIQAGMGPYSTTKLAAAVANAGGLGIISGVGMGVCKLLGGQKFMDYDPQKSPAQNMKEAIQYVKEATQKSRGIFGINVPVAVEFREISDELIQAAIEEREKDPDLIKRMKVIITSAGNPERHAEMIKESGMLRFHVCPSPYHAKKAERAGADLVIASGHEGGGHVAHEPVHSMVLIPEVVKTVSVPVVAAGGFCDGAGLVAALALGAVGIQMGTRFIATVESDFLDYYKDYTRNLGDVRKTIVARGVFGRIRYLKTDATVELYEMERRGCPDAEVADFEMKAIQAIHFGDPKKAAFFGGEVAGRFSDLPTVKELMDRIVKEAEEIIRDKLPKLVT
ncbi:MAG: NAD(P)H-dependent flavin oxidoreductase [Candidatus Freyarchaeota archaeon]